HVGRETCPRCLATPISGLPTELAERGGSRSGDAAPSTFPTLSTAISHRPIRQLRRRPRLTNATGVSTPPRGSCRRRIKHAAAGRHWRRGSRDGHLLTNRQQRCPERVAWVARRLG